MPVWPSRAGPRAGPSPLRSTSARRRRRGASPRRAARASPLRTPGPWARIRSSLRGRAAPPPGTFAPARGPPLAAPLHGPVGPGLALRFSDQPPLLCGVRVDLLGPPRRPPPARCNLRLGTGGGRVPPSRAFAMLGRRHGERRGDVSSSLAHPLGDPIDHLGRAAPPPGALRPGARPAPRRSALGPWTGTASSSPLLPLATHNVRRARGPAGPAAPARRNPRCGDGRGTCPALPGLRQAGPSLRGGAEGGRVPPSRLPAWRWWCGSPSP